jgi:SAM-dependent methyltransferase
MRKDMHELSLEMSQGHWWPVARRAILESLLGHFLGDAGNRSILEAGCGHGSNLCFLQRFGDVAGLECYADAVASCRRSFPDAAIFEQAIPQSLPRRFDVICLFDVLEHVDDDVGALAWVDRHLEEQGTVFLTVPAFPSMWSHWDDTVHHKRRYMRDDLVERVSERFSVDYVSYFNFHLFPLVAAARLAQWLLPSMRTRSGVGMEKSYILNSLFRSIFAAERFWLPRFSLPFGLSLFLAASKRG